MGGEFFKNQPSGPGVPTMRCQRVMETSKNSRRATLSEDRLPNRHVLQRARGSMHGFASPKIQMIKHSFRLPKMMVHAGFPRQDISSSYMFTAYSSSELELSYDSITAYQQAFTKKLMAQS